MLSATVVIHSNNSSGLRELSWIRTISKSQNGRYRVQNRLQVTAELSSHLKFQLFVIINGVKHLASASDQVPRNRLIERFDQPHEHK